MKFSLAIVAAAITGLVAAQSQCNSVAEKVESCAQQCIISAASAVGCTVSTDYECQCSSASSAAIMQKAQNCVISSCGNSAVAVIAEASSVCACASSVEAMGGGAGGATTTAAVPATTNAIPVSAGTTSPASPTTAGSGGSGSGGSGSGGSASSSLSVSMFTGGAALTAGSIGGVMAMLLGVMAAL